LWDAQNQRQWRSAVSKGSDPTSVGLVRVVRRVRLLVAALMRPRRFLRAHVVQAVVDVSTLGGVAGCRFIRDVVGRSPSAELSRIIAQWCADQLTAMLTAMLTDELAGRFLRFDHHAVEGFALRGSQQPSQQHSQTQFTVL
jgi:hypothetical protein